MDALPFAVSARLDGGRLTVEAQGELDVASREDFSRSVDQALERRFDVLLLDLGRLSFVDSVGLKCILDVWNRSRAEDFPMSVIPGGRQVQRAFSLSGLDAVIPVEAPGALGDVPAAQQPAYLHCPSCRAPVEDHDGLLAGDEQCPDCGTALEPSPPSMFEGSVRHPELQRGRVSPDGDAISA